MSIFAGIYSRDHGPNGRSPRVKCIAAITSALSRRQDPVETYSGRRLFVARVDFSAFAESGLTRPPKGARGSSVVAVAGHPFLSETVEASTNRDVQIKTLSAALTHNDLNILNECDGTFALCKCELDSDTLILCTDHVGSRPLYYYVSDEYVYFSTALRVLESLPSIPKRIDLQAVAEGIAFSYPLGNRTPYKGIRVLENGQCLVADAESVYVRSYFRWDEVAPTNLSARDILDQAYERFTQAIRRRLQEQPDAVSLLSGGLDSRCIVTALHQLGAKVFALTWSSDGYLDGELAKTYASSLNIDHLVRPIPACPTWTDYAQAMQSLYWPTTAQPRQPRLIFSGDGGSVGVGYDYLTEEHVAWMRSGRRHRVVDYLVGRNAIPARYFQSSTGTILQEALQAGVESEFAAISSHDPGRDLHVFYMKNDQRRHLHRFFEDNDLSRIEYLLPFYDASFLKLLTSGPVDGYLRHRFYHEWMDRFPSVIKSVAWQTYPGHLQCPVPTTVSAASQWRKRRSDNFRGRNRQAFQDCARALLSHDFPSKYLKRTWLASALVLHALRLKSYTYAFEACNYLHSALANCDSPADWHEGEGVILREGVLTHH